MFGAGSILYECCNTELGLDETMTIVGEVGWGCRESSLILNCLQLLAGGSDRTKALADRKISIILTA
jgi:hypothetical protein